MKEKYIIGRDDECEGHERKNIKQYFVHVLLNVQKEKKRIVQFTGDT